MEGKFIQLNHVPEASHQAFIANKSVEESCYQLTPEISAENPKDYDDLKLEIDNFRNVTSQVLRIKPEDLFQTFSIPKFVLDDFNLKNKDNFDGVRIYLTKETADPLKKDDYKLMLVPCKFEAFKGKVILKDVDPRLPKTAGVNNSFVIMSDCRRPPDCEIDGSIFI